MKLSKLYARLIKDRSIWIYDNGVLIKGNPFKTQSSAAIAIGLAKNT